MGDTETFRNLYLFDVENKTYITIDKVIPKLNKNRIIILGEQHDHENHHAAQLQIIKALYSSNRKIAIGLEMFKSESQSTLDRWVRGEMTDDGFEKLFSDEWNFPISLYITIFKFAREAKIPLIGLNVPRKITHNVARGGFQSLQKEEKEKLQNISCDVNSEYEAYIKSVYGDHAHGQFNFTYFCEAQLVWDTIMAINALKYLEQNKEYSMVILSGIGHALKWGIPVQIRERSNTSYKVILPYVEDNIEPGEANIKDMDYIIMFEPI